jgi:predicted DNA-binding transcriptional regulator AlpA
LSPFCPETNEGPRPRHRPLGCTSGTPLICRQYNRAKGSPAHGHATPALQHCRTLEELEIARSTFYEWRAKKRAPRCIKLPNGEIRIRRIDLETWLDSCEEAA